MSRVKKVVAIGGGEIGRPGYPVETTPIDREIIRLTGKARPRLLFIPTASSDSELYVAAVQKHFGARLGCVVDVLLLVRDHPLRGTIRKKILSADAVYVGGGNTLKMMRLWRRRGVDKFLEAAWRNGVVLSGLSAGSLCWFEWGHSDSMSFYNPKRWKYIRVRGLGFLKGVHCPHYDGGTRNVPRKKRFREMMKKCGGVGIAIDGNAAIEFVGDTFRVITSRKGVGAYRVCRKDGKIISEKISQKKNFTPLAALYGN